MLTPIENLPAGHEGLLTTINGPDEPKQRIEEIGLRRGTWLRVVRSGVPCIVVADGAKLTYRGNNTEILVEVA
jgi:Fe2+ transport system protein FeoA